MPSWAWIVIGVAVVLVVAGLAVVVVSSRRQERQRARLRRRFGPEYNRVAGERGERNAAAELERREQLHERLDIVPLDPRDRQSYGDRWRNLQARFVDEPSSAVREADELVGEVMRKRGYPLENFEQRAADISVDHPVVVENYRAAHAISVADERDEASTEDLRQAMVHYRALFDELLESGQPARRGA